MLRVVIESPFGAESEAVRRRNVAYARALCHHAVKSGCSPIASHLLGTQYLDDSNRDERKVGVAAGLAWVSVADEQWFGLDLGWSAGMIAAKESGLANVAVDISLPDWKFAKAMLDIGVRAPMEKLVQQWTRREIWG